MFKVTLDGFKTKQQAMLFLDWYCNQGEQTFGDHLDIAVSMNKKGLSEENGCYINVSRKGNKGRYFDELPDGYYAEVN